MLTKVEKIHVQWNSIVSRNQILGIDRKAMRGAIDEALTAERDMADAWKHRRPFPETYEIDAEYAEVLDAYLNQ